MAVDHHGVFGGDSPINANTLHRAMDRGQKQKLAHMPGALPVPHQNQASSVFCVGFTEILARAPLTRSSEKS